MWILFFIQSPSASFHLIRQLWQSPWGIVKIINLILKNCQLRQSWREIHFHHLLIFDLQRNLVFLASLAFRIKICNIIFQNNLYIIPNKDVLTIYQNSMPLKLLYKSQITTEVNSENCWVECQKRKRKTSRPLGNSVYSWQFLKSLPL